MQPIFNFDGPAMLSVAAFLGAVVLTAAGLVTALALRSAGRRAGAQRAVLAAGAVAGVYLALLLLVGAAGRGRVVAPGQEKYFCEMDCHLAYSVVEVRRTPVLAGRPARGVWQVVTLRVRFDPETTSEHRGDRPLTPNPRKVSLMDAAGRRHHAADVGTGPLARAAGESVPLTTPLRPGQSSLTRLVFDLPAGAGATRLVLTEADPVTRLLIGHENSPLHGRTTFALRPVAMAAR